MTFSYSCTECNWKSGVLDAAQRHANNTGHVVDINGSLTANRPTVDITAISASAEEKMREGEILRRARDLGLVGRKS